MVNANEMVKQCSRFEVKRKKTIRRKVNSSIFESKRSARPECFEYNLQIKKLTAEVEKLLTSNEL